MKRAFGILSVLVLLGLQVSCITGNNDPKPEEERISSMPHNIPQSWEGSAGLPGGGSGGTF